jgi:dTDP-glucose 4,6-dehydratase
MSTRVVVTGGAGFVGSHLCDALIAEGAAVTWIDNLTTGIRSNVEHLLRHLSFELIEADVTDSLRVRGNVSAVLHSASPASPSDYLRLPLETLKAGSGGTLNVLQFAEDQGARFVLASTSETYGDPQIHPQAESYWGNVNPVGPRSVYDEAKCFTEAASMAYFRSQGTDVSIIRIFNTFGPRMRTYDGWAVPTFIQQALAGLPITVAGNGRQTRSVCYIEDLVGGIRRVLHSNLLGLVNLGNPHEITVLELAQRIIDLIGSSSLIAFVHRPEDDPEIRCRDISLAQSELSWTPQAAIDDGLKHTIEWFRNRSYPGPMFTK